MGYLTQIYQRKADEKTGYSDWRPETGARVFRADTAHPSCAIGPTWVVSVDGFEELYRAFSEEELAELLERVGTTDPVEVAFYPGPLAAALAAQEGR